MTKTHCIGVEATISLCEDKDIKKNVIVVALLTCLMNIWSHSWTTTYAANHENDTGTFFCSETFPVRFLSDPSPIIDHFYHYLILWSRPHICHGYPELYRLLFLTVPPDFQNQNEIQVAANQDYFFKKFSMQKSLSLAGQVFSIFALKMGRNS